MSIGGDADHKIVVWDWSKGDDANSKACVLAESKCGNSRIFDVVCNPYDAVAAVSFVTVGMKHVKFWVLDEAKVLCVRVCAWVRGCEGVWGGVGFRGCVGAWVRGCVGVIL